MKNNILFLLGSCVRGYLMPGFDLFTRRRVRLSRHWLRGERRVLDAGFGNGWFSYLAYRTGAEVTAIELNKGHLQKAIGFYNGWLKIPKEKLIFKELNIYDLQGLESGFDEIICYETLEHIKDDVRVCKIFFGLLKPGGLLHLCCPNCEHPRWRREILCSEDGLYHVRSGYTLESYRSLLEPIGFRITTVEGMGGFALSGFSFVIDTLRGRLGYILGHIFSLPFLILAIPFVWLDTRRPKLPYSIYVKAVKP